MFQLLFVIDLLWYRITAVSISLQLSIFLVLTHALMCQ